MTSYGGTHLQKLKHKYESCWRGPCGHTGVKHQGKLLVDKPRYTIRNLVTDKEYIVDVTHIRPFFYDPAYVTLLNTVKNPEYRRDGG